MFFENFTLFELFERFFLNLDRLKIIFTKF